MPLNQAFFESLFFSSSKRGRARPDFAVRAFSLRVFSLALFLVLLAALFKIQAIQGGYYKNLSEGNRIREVFVPAPRGIIYDRRGTPLVSNIPAYRLVECKNRKTECSTTTISRDQAISLQVSGLPENSDLVIDSSRQYLVKEDAAHLLGYVSEITEGELKSEPFYVSGDKIGRSGVEESYEKQLRGTRGKELVETDALGRRLKVLSKVAAIPGQNIKLTIDAKLQTKVFEILKKETPKNAAVVVSNPKTGAVLALASKPTFDPNIFTDLSIGLDERNSVINSLFSDNSQPLFDRAISGTYPPGSTFKIITATAGLESGKIDNSFQIEDTGVIVIGPYKFANWKFLQDGGTQGVLNVVSALKVSNDIFFYRLGEKLGLDALVSWMGKFGLGNQSGIDLPGEAKGVVPTKIWREKNVPDWYLGDTFHLAIGQGKILVTPLQMNVWTNVIANNGKWCRPHVAGAKDCRDMGISKATLGLVREGLIEACSAGGTAWPLFNFQIPNPKSQIACKTGTAEFGDAENRTHAWLTAFAPAENPEISVTVLVEAGGEGSDVAAPIVRKILEEYFAK